MHTPGKWTVDIWSYDKADPPRKELIIQNETNRIAVLDCDQETAGIKTPYTIPKKQAEANARLIAAAPAMLEALRKIERSLTLAGEPELAHMCYELETARAAIAAVEGGEP